MSMPEKALRVFEGATAVITGGASGIGKAMAEELVSRGCEVVLADLQIEQAEEVAATIRATGGKATASKIDVTDFEAIENLLQETAARTGRLDYMFNNAGIGIGGPLTRQSIEDWNLILDINLRGVINGVQAAYQIMVKQGFGHIVNTASVAGLLVVADGISYATTKHAVVGLSKSLRAKAALENIRVSVLCPGIIRTPILKQGGKYGKNLSDITPEQEQENQEKLNPMPPDEFASKALDAIAKNKAIIVIPSFWRLFWWINRLSPRLGMYLARNDAKNNRKKLQAER